MMKSFMVATALVLPLFSYADVCNLSYGGYQQGQSSFDGPTVCAAGNVDNVVVNGPLTLNSTVVDSASVNGRLVANRAKVNNLQINGELTSNHSSFNSITLAGSANFTDSQIQSITVNSNAGDNYKIYLNGHTKVSGDIVFNNGSGTVYKSKNATIAGQVTGARVVQN